ncbi:MAG: phage major tail tube protein [Roseitalea sp.]|nr:phage major tail tube protein [Roseitalea sp.]MBO6950975.1 phage major tail tube protein [Rhizobiaceae bacterium]MBO6591038.1 phage major tail tube protein [Roseitalea sp.]MBO6599704.1 phage major tail tube protein [Roseitalea sp.]MBO6611460.1 phage major tail tube protein [Roseitalea sp.]
MDVLRFHTAWVDANSYHLDIEDAQIPQMVDQNEAFRGGGMDGEIDVPLGQEKPTASFMLTTLAAAVMRRAGLVPGQRSPITFRGHTVSEYSDDEKEVIAAVTGRVNAQPEPWKAGAKSGVKYPITGISYYKLTIGGELIWERDILNMIRRVGDADQMATARRSLGF